MRDCRQHGPFHGASSCDCHALSRRARAEELAAQRFDHAIERDAAAGKLENRIEQALADLRMPEDMDTHIKVSSRDWKTHDSWPIGRSITACNQRSLAGMTQFPVTRRGAVTLGFGGLVAIATRGAARAEPVGLATGWAGHKNGRVRLIACALASMPAGPVKL